MQIATDDSVLQIINRPMLDCLKRFNADPSPINATSLLGIPVIYNLLKWDGASLGKYSGAVLGVCHWIDEEADRVLRKLIGNSPPLGYDMPLMSATGSDWRVVC
jgi:hypothetical protein